MNEDPTRRRLTWGFVSIILLMTSIVLLGLVQMLNINDDVDHIVLSHNMKSRLVTQMRNAARERSILLHNMAVAEDPFHRDELFMAMRQQGELFIKARAKLLDLELDQEEKTLLEHQNDLSGEAGVLQYEVIDLLAQHKEHDAIQVLVEAAIPLQDKVLSLLDEFTSLQTLHNQQAFEEVNANINNAYLILLPMGILTLLLSVLVAVSTSRKITDTLNDNELINHHLQNAVTMLKHELAGRKRVHARLVQSKKREQAIREHILDPIIMIDRKGIIKSVNPATEQMFGYTQRELLGKSINMLMPEPYRSEHDNYIANYIRTGEAKIIGKVREVICQRKDGSTLPVDLSISTADIEGKQLFIGSLHKKQV